MTELEVERVLALALVLVYVLDATRPLRPSEALVEGLRAGRWRVSFGLVGFELGGRRLCWPNLLRPDRASAVVAWALAEDLEREVPASVRWDPQQLWAIRPARRLGRLCLLSFALVVIAAPILLANGRTQLFALSILLAVLVSVVSGMYLVWHAEEFALKRTNAFGLALIAVVCLPCAPNLLRAALARPALTVSLPAFARAGADDHAWEAFRLRFARVLGVEAAYLTPGSPAHRRTQAVLSEMRGPGT
jgi:hypothetical protein